MSMLRLVRNNVSAVMAFCLCALSTSVSMANSVCFDDAADYYHVDATLLRAIAKVESDYNPKALNVRSFARGMMQIHPTHFERLKGFGIMPDDLFDACTSIYVGAWVLSGFIRQYGPTWRAVGAYGVGNGKSAKVEKQRERYANKVFVALSSITNNTTTNKELKAIIEPVSFMVVHK